ncbi:MAG: hypothetical protein IJ397_03730 [Lachnospiraceae bacterium]|nr:hypothetical protein [Lachnospiraceae bacterium]
MKTRKILAILCCTMLMVSLAGCFPFNLIQDAMQNGGSDGPTSIVTPEPDDSVEPSEEPSDEPSEDNSDFEFNFDDFDDLETSEDDVLDSSDYDDLMDGTAWFSADDEDVMWVFYEDNAVLYDDATHYTLATYECYYNEDAVQYIANDLSEYGLTEAEQREAMEGLESTDKYFCLVFSDMAVYEDDTYIGEGNYDILPYIGYESTDDDMIYFDLIDMNEQNILSFYTFTDEETSSEDVAVTGDVQRVGDEKYGYTDIPADYVVFTDPYNDGDYIQYSDPTGTNILTMTYYEESYIDAENLAYNLLEQLETDTGIDPSSVTGAMVTLDGCEAFQVYGYYPDEDIFLVVWVLDSPEDDYTHYIAVEFTSDNYDLFDIVEKTYHVSY